MKKITCFFFLLIIANNLLAQEPCNDETIMAVKGKWTTKPNADMKAVNPQAIIRIDKMQKMLEAAYSDPKGMVARRYQPSTNKSLIENGPVSYRLISGFFSYYCNQNVNKLLLGGETGTWVNTFVNGFGWFISDQYDLLSIKVNGENVYVLPSEKGKWKGYPIYEATADRDKGRCIILTHNNQVPWKPITQQQYLHALKNFWKKQKNETDNSYTEQEEGLKKRITAIQNSTMKQADKDVIISGLQKSLDDLPKRKTEFISQDDKYRNDKLSVVDKYLNENSSLLHRPAIMERRLVNDFEGSFSTLENGGQMLVTIDPGYFNKQLHSYAAQLIVLYWTWDNNAPALNFKKQFEENFPIDKLKEMIDK